jgi:pimeloyl-ACP methyl ester carboxylesterase
MKSRIFWVFACACILLNSLGLGKVWAATEGKKSIFWTPLTWTTPDGIKMVGWLHKPRLPRHYTWVLLHGLGSTKEEWDKFAKQLGIQGQGVLIYDMRGHGASHETSSGETISYKSWTTAGPGTAWDKMAADMEGAVTLLHEQYGLARNRIAVGGASLGANVALVYASQHEEVPALILLSPGLEYAGVQTRDAWKAYGLRKVLLAASPGDAYAYDTVHQFCVNSSYSTCPMLTGAGAMHGVNMFQGSFTQQLLEWMSKAEKN